MDTLQQSTTLQELLDDEVLIIEDGGEMPEVTYNGTLHYLTKDPDGPAVTLSEEDILRLKVAVVEGYKRIITRDLLVENRDKGLYRGLERCAANWGRLRKFCQKEKLDLDGVAQEVCKGLKNFFNTEVNDVISLGKPTCVNCTVETLNGFFGTVGFNMSDLPKEWKSLTL